MNNEYDENDYLKLLNNIINNGIKKTTRNATTLSLFGEILKFDISQCFPLLTTKKMYWRGIVEELLWFIKGHTDSKLLENKQVNIWKGNSSKEFINNLKLN